MKIKARKGKKDLNFNEHTRRMKYKQKRKKKKEKEKERKIKEKERKNIKREKTSDVLNARIHARPRFALTEFD